MRNTIYVLLILLVVGLMDPVKLFYILDITISYINTALDYFRTYAILGIIQIREML